MVWKELDNYMTDGNPLRDAIEVRSSITNIIEVQHPIDEILVSLRQYVSNDIANSAVVVSGKLYGRNVNGTSSGCDQLSLILRTLKDCINDDVDREQLNNVFSIMEHSIKLLKRIGGDIEGDKFTAALLAFISENKTLL